MAAPELPGLILQHESAGPADLFGDWLDERGIAYETANVWEDGPPQDPSGRSWICALGSDQTPGRPGPDWIKAEVDFLRSALDADVPVLGLCFGGQALAVAAGGEIAPSDPPEVGWAEIETSVPELIPSGPWLHFHYDQLRLPPGATELARSPAGVAAFRIGHNLGLQFHPETGPEIAGRWVEMERSRLGEIGIDPAGVVTGGERLGDRARELAYELFDGWRRDVLPRRHAIREKAPLPGRAEP